MFIYEDGSGVANANSLASVEFADEYHADRRNTTWSTFSLEKKQSLLIKATDYFSGMYGSSLIGVPVSLTQSLPFPRTVYYTNVGNPIAIQEAITEYALIANTTPLTPVVTRGKKRVKVGPIEVEYDGNAATAPKFVAATLKFNNWLKPGASNPMMGRVVRV